MSELHDPSIRIRRRRRRRSHSREREEPVPSTPFERSLLVATILLISCSLLLLLGMANPGGMGVGSLQPSFRVDGGRVIVNNEERTSWSGVSVETYGLWGHSAASSNAVYGGSSQQVDGAGGGPYVVTIRGTHGGNDGYWVGLVY